MAEEEKKQHSVDPDLEAKLPAPYAEAIRRGSVPAEVLKHSHDGDLALAALQASEGQVIELDEATNKRILRRIDFNLIPVGSQKAPP